MSCEVIFLSFTARAVNAVMASGRRSVQVNIPMKPQRVRSRFSRSKQTEVIVLESHLHFLIAALSCVSACREINVTWIRMTCSHKCSQSRVYLNILCHELKNMKLRLTKP